jgi:hypothetical protein
MSISKFILFGLSLTHAFLTPYNFIKPPKLHQPKRKMRQDYYKKYNNLNFY